MERVCRRWVVASKKSASPTIKEAYRVIYVASIGARVYVLHAFHKKSKQGVETPKTEIDLARRRYRMLVGEIYE
jgi:phage-related protein